MNFTLKYSGQIAKSEQSKFPKLWFYKTKLVFAFQTPIEQVNLDAMAGSISAGMCGL